MPLTSKHSAPYIEAQTTFPYKIFRRVEKQMVLTNALTDLCICLHTHSDKE